MNMLTVKEISEIWNISERMVRRFCVEGRIPEAVTINGSWMIPEGTPKPKRKPKEPAEKPELISLAKQIIYQRLKNNHFGIYEHIQVYRKFKNYLVFCLIDTRIDKFIFKV